MRAIEKIIAIKHSIQDIMQDVTDAIATLLIDNY